MTIEHHAGDATLLSFAAGTLPEVLAAVVANHAAMCPQCRSELAAMERLGALLMAELPEVSLTDPVPRAPAQAHSETDGGGRPRAADFKACTAAFSKRGDIPAPLMRLVGPGLGEIRWKRLGYGVWHLPLPVSPAAKGDLRLIRIAPGQVMPEHGHGGSELTLILDGSYSDQIGRYCVGDLADVDEDIEHTPVADGKTGCICLIASVERAKFKGLLARVMQPLIGL